MDRGLATLRRCRSGEWRNWQTRRIQVPVAARLWGFKSPLAHSIDAGHALDAFRVVETAAPFVEPLLNQYDLDSAAQATFISARGASGKSAMAEQLSRRLGAPLCSLGEDKAVSGDALATRCVVDGGPMAEFHIGRERAVDSRG